MRTYPSRSETRELEMFSAAEKGLRSLTQAKLYPTEIRRLQKDGFNVTINGLFDSSRNLYCATIDWHNAFPKGVPHIVYSYIIGIIETKPQSYITNFAQELYVISSKSYRSKK